ncbi:MAG: HEPN domain-containing protein [Clostridia bacterium]|nr:HEPN domain-containing protein [Clostridia bacterium]
MDERTMYWINLAEYDIDTAAAMLETKRFLYVGFMCHQAIEKAIKAVLSTMPEVKIPKVHNLIKLAEMAGIFDTMTDQQKKVLFVLNPLNIESRYPSYKETLLAQLTAERCEKIITDTKEMFTWIKTLL